MFYQIKSVCVALLFLTACENPKFKQVAPDNLSSIAKVDEYTYSMSEFGMESYGPWKIYLVNPQGLVTTSEFTVERQSNSESNKTGVFIIENYSSTNFSLGFTPEGWYVCSIVNWDGKGISNAEGVTAHLISKGFTHKKTTINGARTEEILIKPAKEKNRFLICRLTRQENGAINTMSFKKLEYK